MKNHEIFGQLSPRMESFRREVLDAKPYIDSQRAIIVTESYKKNKDKNNVMKRALMLKDILEKMSIFIEDKTLIVGNQAQANRNAPIFPEYTLDFVINELDLFEKRDGDVFYIEEKTKEELRGIKDFWDKNNLRAKGDAFFPDEVKIFMEKGFFGMEGKLNSGDAHIVADYQGMLDMGLEGYEKKCLDLKANLDLSKPESLNKYQFYKAVLVVIEAVKNFAKRYADLAKNLAEDTKDENRKRELLEISEICDRVPYKKPRNFKEAVQAVWFIQLILQIESNGHSLSFGRFDQYINQFLAKDLEEGIINEDYAVELMTNLWIKAMTINKVRSQAHTFSSAGSPMYQNVTIGGQTPDGKDAVNKASFLVLKSVAQSRMPQPNLTVRYHKNINQEFMDQALEVVKIGFGMPAFNSDEVIIPSFIEKGVKKEDAYNYTAVGCVETAVAGKWGYRCTGMSYLNLPRTLLIAMNNGVDKTSGKKFCKDYGDFTQMKSFDDLMYAVKETIKELTHASVIIENAVDMISAKEVPDILCSTLTQDCLKRGTTIKEGGAIYDFISGLQVGIADMADSLAAIKKLVFEENKISKQELKDALDNNFQSEENEKIRQMLINEAPKYGNDIDYVDKLVVEVYEDYLDDLKNYPNTRYKMGPIGGIRYGGTSSISANVGQGLSTMATPNGRFAKTPLAEGCSPAHSMDTSGPTAVYKSVSKLPTHDITGGVLLNQKISPGIVKTKEDTKKLEMLIRTFFNRLDGYHVQYNVVDKQTLLDAQKNPEKHKDLIVRVAGYSAFFNVLSKATQDDIIGRSEQSLV